MANEVKIIVTGQNKAKNPVTEAQKDVDKLSKAVDKVPDKKVINFTVKDGVVTAIDEIDRKDVKDKTVTVKADDQATPVIEKASKEKPPAVVLPLKTDTSNIESTFGDAGKQGASAFAGGFTGGLLGGGVIDVASNIITSAFQSAGDKQKLAADVQNMMGVSPEQAKSYGDRIGRMFWDGIGTSKDQIASAFGNLSSDVKGWGDLTVEQQDRVVKGAVKISSAFKVDVVEPIQAASAMVNSKMVPSYEDAFDIITTGYQTLGSRADDALDTLQEYAPYFEDLGFTGAQALGVLQQGLQAGARDTDYIADAWKEFGIRIIDGSKLTTDALKDLGLNAKKIPKMIEEGGPKAQEAIGMIIDKLGKIKDPLKKNEIGFALFGAQWEDTMGHVIQSTDLAAAKATEFKGATEEMSTGAITSADKLGRKWDEMAGDLAESFSTMVLNQDSFQNTMNDSIFAMLGFGDTVEEQVAKTYGLGISLDGTSEGFQKLADTVGGYADPRFVDMIKRMSDTQLAAYGVTRSVNDVGHTVLTLPNGKTITIDTNSGKVVSDLSNVRVAVNNLPTQKWFTYYMDTVVRGPAPNTLLPMPFQRAAGGPVAGFGAASGGARGARTRVNERGFELGREPDGVIRDLQSGTTVIPAGQSAAIMSGAGQVGLGSGGRTAVDLNINVSGAGNEIERMFAEVMKRILRTSGKNGDLTKAFGGR